MDTPPYALYYTMHSIMCQLVFRNIFYDQSLKGVDIVH